MNNQGFLGYLESQASQPKSLSQPYRAAIAWTTSSTIVLEHRSPLSLTSVGYAPSPTMKTTLSQSLYTQFPTLHAQPTLPDTQSPLSVELDIGDGWYQIYYKLCNELQCIIDIHELDPTAFHFTTVKQKLGLLRVYMHARTDETAKAVGRAVEESGRTCERCGGEGRLYVGRRMRVRCEGCRRADEVERAAETARYRVERERWEARYDRVGG